MKTVEILGRPKYRSLRERLNEKLDQTNKKSQLEGKGSSCDPELIYTRDDPEINQTYYADYRLCRFEFAIGGQNGGLI